MGRRTIKVSLDDEDASDILFLDAYEAKGRIHLKARFARDCLKAGFAVLIKGNSVLVAESVVSDAKVEAVPVGLGSPETPVATEKARVTKLSGMFPAQDS